ncbi:MAG: hypothetical protein ABL949_06315 [Fimbriimonadaceae bacterium]
MIRNKDHNKLSTIIMIGLGGIVIGIGLIVMGLMTFLATGPAGAAMVGLGILLSTVGAFMTLGALVYGLRQERGDDRSADIVVVRDALIIGRYATNSIGEMLFDEAYLDFDDPKTKLYLKLEIPGRPSLEVRTTRPVWSTCGEGMRGIAQIQGSWMGQFEPNIAAPRATGNPYRTD